MKCFTAVRIFLGVDKILENTFCICAILEVMLFNCLCGVSFERKKKVIDFHLENFCPVYKQAFVNLVLMKNGLDI